MFILVLILLTVLFAVGAGAGLFGGDGNGKNTQDKWQNRLKRLTDGQDVLVEPGEIQALKPPFASPLDKVFVVPQGASLEYKVAPSDRRMRMRTLELTLAGGGKARVKWIRDRESEPLLDIPMRDKSVKVQVTKDGGKFVLSCERGVGMPPVVRVMMK
jgi:hypothetical protein